MPEESGATLSPSTPGSRGLCPVSSAASPHSSHSVPHLNRPSPTSNLVPHPPTLAPPKEDRAPPGLSSDAWLGAEQSVGIPFGGCSTLRGRCLRAPTLCSHCHGRYPAKALPAPHPPASCWGGPQSLIAWVFLQRPSPPPQAPGSAVVLAVSDGPTRPPLPVGAQCQGRRPNEQCLILFLVWVEVGSFKCTSHQPRSQHFPTSTTAPAVVWPH